jgi:oligo-alginate lyase
MRLLWLLLIILGCTTVAQAARNYYTEERLAVMRSNVEKYDWAKSQRDAILRVADKWAAYSDERLRTLVPPPQVPRSYLINMNECPVHGLAARKDGLYKWKIDFDRPWKVVCPAGGEEYPSNDFGAFLASGVKDRSLLTGETPDDGWGWTKPGTKNKYCFVAYYCMWSVRLFLHPAIQNLSKAYLLTGDPKYAHKCAVLLWQLAQYYPDYDYAKQAPYEAQEGKLLYHTWETWTGQLVPEAYDAIRPALAGDTELQKLTGQSAAQIETAIRERLLLEIARAVMDPPHRIQGNYGMHQLALLRVAAVLRGEQTKPSPEAMVRWVLNNQQVNQYTDLGVSDALLNIVLRDGVPFESPGYNYNWNVELTDVAKALRDVGVDLFADPRFRKLQLWPFTAYLCGQFTPSLGDTQNMFAIGSFWDVNVLNTALQSGMKDPRIIAALRAATKPARDLFEKPLEEVLTAEHNVPGPALGTQSSHLPGYGLACLQAGNEANRSAAAQFYGYYIGHSHFDRLSLTYYSHGNCLLTDFGYPETADYHDARRGFFSDTLVHNTVLVDARSQEASRGKLHAYQASSFAQLVDASAEEGYPGKASLYRRCNLLIEATPAESYLVDIFYVRGGKQHDYAVHGTQADFTSQPELGPVQSEGTLAGADVPYGKYYDDDRLRDGIPGVTYYYGYKGSHFQWLKNVQRRVLKAEAAVCTWTLTAPTPAQQQRPWQGVALRAHFTGQDEELIAADAVPQMTKVNPPTVKFMIRRRTGENLASRFVTVYEGYKDQPYLKQVREVPITPDDGDAVAVRVELVSGETHYVFHSLHPERRYVVEGKVTVSGQAACVVLDADGQPLRAMLTNGTELTYGGLTLKGKGLRRSHIAALDYKTGLITLTDAVLDPAGGVGQTVIVSPDTLGDSVTVRQVLDAKRFSIGEEDLRVAGGTVTAVKPESSEIVCPLITFFARPGMTVLNGRGEVEGRIKGGKWVLDRGSLPALRATDFPAEPDGSTPRYTVVIAGPGDEVLVPDLVQWQK